MAMVRVPPCRGRPRPRARVASSGGWESPAGEAVARFPPTVPRLRIWGEPTVRAARASAGALDAELGDDPPCRCTAAPRRTIDPSSVQLPGRQLGDASSGRADPAGRARSKLMSTIRSVPPQIGVSPGRSARAATASSQLTGRSTPPTPLTTSASPPRRQASYRLAVGRRRSAAVGGWAGTSLGVGQVSELQTSSRMRRSISRWASTVRSTGSASMSWMPGRWRPRRQKPASM